MKFFILVSLIGLVAAHPSYEPVQKNYHAEIGIPEAARIKAAEEAGGASRIVGGSAAPEAEYTYLGGLLITLDWGATSVCGCSLISPNRILTAAHCWYDGGNQAVRFEIVLGSITLFSGGTRVFTSDVKTHESWNPNLLQHDIAIGSLSVPVIFTDEIQPISLPTSHNNQYTGSWAWAAGFGRQSDTSGIGNNQVMHHVNLQVISNAVCQYTFGTYITSGHICTDGSNYSSPCRGDSGGPLALSDKQNRKSTLIGVVSFGSANGCELGYAAAFVRVSAYLDWIKARM